MITDLTAAQWRRMEEVKEEWLGYGMDIPDTDERTAERCMQAFYQAINTPAPQIIFCDSPLGTTILSCALDASLDASLLSSLDASLRASLCASLLSSLDASLLSSLDASLLSSLRASLLSSLDASLLSSLRASLLSSLDASLLSSLRASLLSSLDASLLSSLRASLLSSLDASLRASLGSSLLSSLDASLLSSLGSSLLSSLDASLRASLDASLRASLGNHWHYGLAESYWPVFYAVCQEIGVPFARKDSDLLQLHLDYCRSALWCTAYTGIAFISRFPAHLKQQRIGDRLQLHNPHGAAIEFHDGFSVYALNGVLVPQAVVDTSADTLSAQTWVVEETNAEIRREAVRKMGIEQVCQQLKAKTVDRHGAYELLLLDVGRDEPRPYLKMKNPSIGVYHIEGVAPGITTVKNALQWRNHLDEAEMSDEDGLDWYQQGDVILKPKQAGKLKSSPTILT